MRGESARGEPVRGEPVRGEPVRGEPVRGEPVRGEPVRGESVRGEPEREDGLPVEGASRSRPAGAFWLGRRAAAPDGANRSRPVELSWRGRCGVADRGGVFLAPAPDGRRAGDAGVLEPGAAVPDLCGRVPGAPDVDFGSHLGADLGPDLGPDLGADASLALRAPAPVVRLVEAFHGAVRWVADPVVGTVRSGRRSVDFGTTTRLPERVPGYTRTCIEGHSRTGDPQWKDVRRRPTLK